MRHIYSHNLKQKKVDSAICWEFEEGGRASLEYLVAQIVKNPPAKRGTSVQSLGWEDSLGKEMATHSNILAWRIP